MMFGLRRGIRREAAEADEKECVICFSNDADSDGRPPIPSGCACRGTLGFAHASCRTEAAINLRQKQGRRVWRTCGTCQQTFGGAMRVELAREWVRNTERLPDDSEERLESMHDLAISLLNSRRGKSGDERISLSVEAEKLLRQVLEIEASKYGEEYPLVLSSNLTLASIIQNHQEAEAMLRGLLPTLGNAMGVDDRQTMMCAIVLAKTLFFQGKVLEATCMAIQWKTRAAQVRVLGKGHLDTKTSTRIMVFFVSLVTVVFASCTAALVVSAVCLKLFYQTVDIVFGLFEDLVGDKILFALLLGVAYVHVLHSVWHHLAWNDVIDLVSCYDHTCGQILGES